MNGWRRLKSLFWPVVILVLAFVALMVLKQTKPQAPTAQVEEKVWPVAVQRLQREAVAPMQTLFGQVQTRQMVTVAAPIAGVVAHRHLLSGERFDAGTALLALSHADAALPVTRAKADLADMKAQIASQKLTHQANQKKLEREQKVLALKKAEVARHQRLLGKDMVSQAALDQAKEALARQEFAVVSAQLAVNGHPARLAQLQAQASRAQVDLEQAQLDQTRAQVRAPFAGRVASVPVSEGDRVNAGETLIRFYAMDSLEVKAKIPRDHLPSVYAALKQQPLLAHYEHDGQLHALPLTRLAGEGTASGVDGFFSLPGALSHLRPGDLLSVRLSLPQQSEVFAVPYAALYGTDRVYVVEQNRLALKKVTLVGQTQNQGQTWALVRGELAPGDSLVVTHLPNATAGLKVSVRETQSSKINQVRAAARPSGGGQ